MKKLLAMVLALMLLAAAASAEVVYGGNDAAVEAAALEAASLLGTTAVKYETEMDAANAALEDTSLVCVATQQIMLEGLQGYSRQDLRKAFTVCGVLAQRDYVLICSPETKALCENIADVEAYFEEHEYELILARIMMYASNQDYVTTVLFNDYGFDQEEFFDDEEIMDNLGEGAYVYVVDSATAAARECESVCMWGAASELTDTDGDMIIAFTAGSDAEGLYSTLSAAVSDEAFAAALDGTGYYPVQAELSSVRAHVAEYFVEYMNYMVEEGLAFYED